MLSADYISLESEFSAHNYHPIPVVLSRGEGVWVWDVEGRKHMDMLSAYSAVNQGHRHPRIVQAATEQMGKITLTSRAFHNDRMAGFCQKVARLCAMDMVLPMNTGAEAVETAIKCARRHAYFNKGVEADSAEIVVCANNFHGRTTTIVSFSSDEGTRSGFGPFTPGFKTIPFGDAEALEAAIGPNTAAFLFEPIQGEAGVVVPPAGYLARVRDICSRRGILLMADEIQTGLGRCGRMFACDEEQVKPDIYILGKALGGGVLPVSAVVGARDVMSVFDPGSHGSTFGGNPLACAVAEASLDVIIDENLAGRARELGRCFRDELRALVGNGVVEDVRGRGLLNAVQIHPGAGRARVFTEALMKAGLLAKETHDTTIRFAPPLVISRDELDWALRTIAGVLTPA